MTPQLEKDKRQIAEKSGDFISYNIFKTSIS